MFHEGQRHLVRDDCEDDPMTIVVGLVAKDGVVVAADSQAGSFRGVSVKRTDYSKIHELAPPDSNVCAVVAGAGMVAFINKAVGLLREKWKTKRYASALEIEEEVETIMVELTKRYVFDRMKAFGIEEELPVAKSKRGKPKGFQPGLMQPPHAHLLFGAADKEGGLVLGTVGPQAIAETEDTYTSIGSGSAYAEYLLSRLHTEHLTIEQAIECAVYTIEEVKKIDTDCGGPVRAVGVSKQGIQTRSSDELRELSSSLSARDELLSRVWRYMVLGRKKADEIAAFLESRECAETAGAGLEPPPG